MRKYFLLLTIIVIGMVISACGTKQPSVSLAGVWKLTSYGSADAPTPVLADVEAGLTFNEDGTVTGNSGCNGLGGKYAVDGDQVTFKEIVSTLMACDDPRMVQEGTVRKVLTGTATFKVEGNTLTLTNGDVLLALTR